MLNQSMPVDTCFVVNNNSNDGTREYLDSIDDDRVRAYHEETNLGGAGGFSRALTLASREDFDFVLIIDDDAMIERSYMAKIIDFAKKNPKYNAYAGTVITEGKIDIYHRRRFGSKLIFWERMLEPSEYDRPRKIDFATFCGLVIRGEELKRIGAPNADYFIWYDDTEFCLRINGGIALVPKAKLNHKTSLNYENKGILSRITWKHYYGYRNRYDCAKRHIGLITCLHILGEYAVFYVGSLGMMLIRPDNMSQWQYNERMLRQVFLDCLTGKLGINDNYLP